jgi:Tol biopolymer transport system component
MRIRIVAMGLVMVLCTATIMTAQNGYELFQQGLLKERGEGDIAGAIKIYERIVHDFKSNRPLVAKTLVQLGACYEKLMGSQAQTYYDQVIRDYSDQKDMLAEARRRRNSLATYAATEALRERRVWQDASFDGFASSVSADGGYLGLVDRSADGGLAIRDLRTGVNRKLIKATDADAGGLVISRDGKQVAYSGRDRADESYELRVGTINATQDRLLLSSRDVRYQPKDWSPAGKILTLISRTSGSQIAMVDAASGAVQTLKAFLGSAEPGNLTLSPDGRFVAYDFPQDRDSTKRDVFVLETAGLLHEYDLVRNPANDYVLGWTPDGKWLLFGSDRSNKQSIWAIETLEGKPAGMAPLQIKSDVGEVRSLGMTRTGSLMYSPSSKPTEVRALESILPELARLQLAALQQPISQTASTGSIDGYIVKGGTNEPVADANVELTRLEGTREAPLAPGALEAYGTGGNVLTPPAALAPELQYTKSDERGRFSFRNLKPGGYRIVAMPATADCPCNPAEYGQRHPQGRGMLLPVAAGQTVRDVRLDMALAGTVMGRVSDVDGEPLGHASVIAAQIVYVEGRRLPRVEQVVLTDEHGDYRLLWLPPGRYVIAAAVESPESRTGRTWIGPAGRSRFAYEYAQPLVIPRFLANGDLIEEAYALAYLGGTIDPDQARQVDIPAGAVIGGADISMSGAKLRSHHIRGVFTNGITGQPAGGIRLQAIPVRPSPYSIAPTAVTNADGTFDLAGAVAGKYQILSPYLPSAAGGQAIGFASVEMGNGDIEGVRIVAQPTFTLNGHIVIEGRSPAENEPDLRKMRVLLPRPFAAATLTPPQAPNNDNTSVDANGRFTRSMPPGDFVLGIAGLPEKMYIKSATLGNEDLLSAGLHINAPPADLVEVVLATDTGEVTGVATGPKREVMTNVVVVLVPDSLPLRRRINLYKSTTSDAYGRFTISSVPPGDYKMFAWEYVREDAWTNTQFLDMYESAGKLIHVAGSKKLETEVTVTATK